MEMLLNELEGMSCQELQALWEERFGERCVMRSAELLRRRLAWRLQEERHGGVKPEVKRRLREVNIAFSMDKQYRPKAKTKVYSGSTLTRNWKGQTHTVKVMKDGYIYKGEKYKGLSKIAREITGTRWSGPVFFGLKKSTIKKRAEV